MKGVWLINAAVMAALLATLSYSTHGMVREAAERLETGATTPETVAKPAAVVATTAEEGYCSEHLKTVLRRVLQNCGLLNTGRRGCQPGELRTVAQIEDADFNALFLPLQDRGGLVLYDRGKEELDPAATKLVDRLWSDRQGASYYLVVARASTDGDAERNRALSHRRANSILFRLQERFGDPNIEKKVGLLWLGEEYAQLGESFCEWTTSRPGTPCKEELINRSAVVSWIDCRL
jgi:outer membrane protein OmpA-like peptidoglycan-associated protein